MKLNRQYKKDGLHTKIIHKIEDLPKAQWDNVFPSVIENYSFYKTLDESHFTQFYFHYILVYHRKELVGIAPCFSLDYALDTSVGGPIRRFTNGVKKVFPHIFSLKALVCGIPMGRGHIGIRQNGNTHILHAIQRRMEMFARKIHAPVIAFKDFDASYNKTLAPLQQNGFLKIDSLPTTLMPLTFNSIDGYMKNLSANNRSNLKRKFKKADQANIKYSVHEQLDEKTLEEAYTLYLEIVNTHDLRFEIIPIDFFRNIAHNMPQEARFFIWEAEGQLACFMFCLISKELLLNYFLGFNYALANKYHLYFIEFRDSLDWALSKGITHYEMGSTGYDPKRRLGFNLVPLYLYAKMRPKLFRPALKLLVVLLKFDNFDPLLREWKKSDTEKNRI